ncbi:MAG: secretion system protein E [Verrucomicrobiales bacterium]|nr:secretion system protein E [Verrucomicrobiales bacterium]|tara:strand:+ start:975 stop:2723 length:1749 start_codon:yes stop_codon:yes gene_type:complete
MSKPASIASTGFKHLLGIASRAAGEDLASSIDVKALKAQFVNGGSFVDWLLDHVELSERDLGNTLADDLGLVWNEDPLVDEANADVLKAICPPPVAIKYRVLPLRAELEVESSHPGMIELAHYDPVSSLDRQLVRRALNCPIVWKLAPRRKVLGGLQKLYGVGGEIFDDLLANRAWEEDEFSFKEVINVIDEDDEEASVVKFVNQILNEALNQRATDIHIEPLRSDLRVRYRVDGVLRKVSVPDNIVALQSSVIARIKLMAGLDIAEKRKPQDGRIALQVGGDPIDTRVATIPGIEGESISLRLLGQEQFNMDRLQMESGLRQDIERILERPNGIVLVTGPTGCGKSTSLFCFLSQLNSEDRKIVTIEDPVENRLEGAIQIAVKPEIDLTFASGLRSVLRGDPNVIMVGEIRDLETAEIAVQAALTGHLVFSTLHTNDSIGGITRLVDMGVEPFLIAASVRAFVAQRLVRRLCRECRLPADYTEDFLNSVGFPLSEAPKIFEANPDGCDACAHSGYYGRAAVYEIFKVTEKVQELITAGSSKQELYQQGKLDGFRNMREYGWEKVIEGITTIEEVVSSTEMS